MNSILEMGIESTLAILIPPNDPRALICALTIIVVLFRKKNVRTILAFCIYCPHQVCCQITFKFSTKQIAYNEPEIHFIPSKGLYNGFPQSF